MSVRGPGTHRQGLHIEDEEVEGHGQDDGSQKPEVDPGRHPDQRLVLRQAVGEMKTEPSALDVIKHTKQRCMTRRCECTDLSQGDWTTEPEWIGSPLRCKQTM